MHGMQFYTTESCLLGRQGKGNGANQVKTVAVLFHQFSKPMEKIDANGITFEKLNFLFILNSVKNIGIRHR